MKRNANKIVVQVLLGAIVLLATQLTSCSSTSAIPDGEQLYTGLEKIQYTNYEKNLHAETTQLEMESALAAIPNGSLFGSSYYRTPFPIRLWIWNAFSQSESTLGKWMTKTFGTQPKLMSQVNPDLRSSVAESQLKKFGYFNGKVTYNIKTGHNPKKAKLSYTVDMGHLWTVDTLQYTNFPMTTDSLIRASRADALIKRGYPFSVSTLDGERQRIARLLRNNGFYYQQAGYSSYLADTLNAKGKVALKLQMADSLDTDVLTKWYIGKVTYNLRRSFLDTLYNSTTRRAITINYNGRKSPIRTGVLLRGLRLRPRKLYCLADEEETTKYLQGTGLFANSDLVFTKRSEDTETDTLDLSVNCVMEKRYDFYVGANAKGKTTGRMGPELVLGFTKLNTFRGGEKLDINVHGSYEWQTAHRSEGAAAQINSYYYGADVALVLPRLLTPRNLFGFRRDYTKLLDRNRRHYYFMPTTTLKASSDVLNRAGYYKRHVVSGELTYDFWTSVQSHHSFSPLILSYEYMTSTTHAFDSLLNTNAYLQVSMRDQFVPKMSYTYQYTSPSTYRNPITWSATVSEAGNLISLGYMVAGKKWDDKNKKMFKNPFAQFFKLEGDFVKLWHLSESSYIVGHASAGAIWSYGNATKAPYYEQFYIGGANSVRAFTVRSIGPGRYKPTSSKYSYIEQTGDLKLLFNTEYRTKLFGSLHGAVFLDAGNVWTLKKDEARPQSQFKLNRFYRDMAVGTGVGLRYDMGMFVIRVDWGIGLHVPYDTGKSGFYNVSSFKDAQSIHLAVGYPF